jgi:hypothetical protein
MKKLILPFLAVAALAMTSCSSKSAEATDETVDEGAALKAKIENCTDPDSLQAYVQQAAEYAATLDPEAAQAYVSEVVTVVSSNGTAATSSVSFLEALKAFADSTTCATIDNVTGVKSAAETAVESTVEAGKDAAQAAVDNAKAQAVNAATDAAAKADAAAQAAKTAATNAANTAADNAKTKAANAIQSAADKAKNALGK